MNKKLLIMISGIIILIGVYLAIFLLRPISTPQATLSFVPDKTVGGGEIRLTTSLKNITGFSLRLISKDADLFQLNPNQELINAGWQFPVHEHKSNQFDLAGVYLRPKAYSFEKEIVIAWVLVKPDSQLPDKVSFEFDPKLTKITTKDGKSFTPNLSGGFLEFKTTPPVEKK